MLHITENLQVSISLLLCCLPLTGSGTTESISNISRDKLIKYFKSAINPAQATFVVVGDITLDEAVSLLNEKTKNWKSTTASEKVELTLRALYLSNGDRKLVFFSLLP